MTCYKVLSKDLMPEPVLMREPCPECGGDGVDGISYTGVFPCGRCEGTGTIEKSSMVGATIKPHLMVEIAEYAGGKSDRVMIWVNSRDTSRGGYCIDGVPREVAPTIVAALNSTAADALNHWKALARYNGNALVRNAAASSPPTSASPSEDVVERVADDGPQPVITPPKLTCTGCRHLKTEWWKDYLDNDETDSGTSARCEAVPDEHGGKCITAYWSNNRPPPSWCPRATLAAMEVK